MAANAVNTVGDANNNLNGTGETNFDIGLALGVKGSEMGFVQTLSFDMTATGLSAALFIDQRVAMRVQSIEGTDFAYGSAKLVGDGAGDGDGDGDGGGDTTVPTPAPIALIGLGMLLLGLARRRAAI